MKNKKYIATVVALLILVSGTYAWQSFSQLVTNEIIESVDPPGGRLHDYFNGVNKDVFVENYALGDDAPDIYARIRLREYFEHGPGAGSIESDVTKIEVLPGDLSSGELPKLGEPDSWDIYVLGSEVVSGVDSIRTYRDLDLGGETIYLPTFNHDNTDKEVESNGSFEGKDGDGRDNVFARYSDYREYSKGEKVQGTLVDADDQVGVSTEHTATETNTAKVITMAKWIDDGCKIDDAWVYDDDGWFYYAAPIQSQTATGLLLDAIEIKGNPKDEWYYAVDVVAELATAGDWGIAPDKDNQSGQGMYESDFSELGLSLLNIVSSRTVVTDVVLTKADGTPISPDGEILALQSSINLVPQLNVSNPGILEVENEVTWTVTEKSVAKSGSGLKQDELNATIVDNVFKPLVEMVGYYYEIKATSVLSPDKEASFEVYIYDDSKEIILYTEDDKVDVKAGAPLQIYVAEEEGGALTEANWRVEELSGNSGLSQEQLNESVSSEGLFTTTVGMAGGVYKLTAYTIGVVEYSQTITIGVYGGGSGKIEGSGTSDGSGGSDSTVSVEVLGSNDVEVGSNIAFTSVISGLQNQELNWSIQRKSGTSDVTEAQVNESFDTSTLTFTPIPGMGGCTYIIKAISQVDGDFYGTKEFTVTAGSVTINSSGSAMNIGDSMAVSAAVSGINGSEVEWSIKRKSGTSTLEESEVNGTFDETTGEFTPISGMSGCTYTITGTSTVDGTVSGTKDISVNSGSVAVTSANNAASMTLSSTAYTLQMSSEVSNITGSDVTWTVSEDSGDSDLTESELNDTISDTGLFTPLDAMTGGSYIIKATSKIDPTKSNSKTISIAKATISISVANDSTYIQAGKTIQYSATISGTRANTATWTRSGQSSSSTTVSTSGGLLTVAELETVGGTITVKGACSGKTGISATKTIKIDTSSSDIIAADYSDTTITLGGESFYVIDTDEIDGQSIAKLMLVSHYGWGVLFGSTNTYAGSNAESKVKEWYNAWSIKAPSKDSGTVTGSALESLSLGTPALTSDTKAFLLSTSEMWELKFSIIGIGSGYWLRTPSGTTSAYYAYSSPSSASYIYGTAAIESITRYIRPALWVYL